MPLFPPDTLARWTSGRWHAPPRAAVTGFGVDTRRLGPGQMFVALKTEKRDGHAFLEAARAAGAAAALVAAPQPDSSLPQLVVADPLAAFQAVAREHRRAFPGPVVGITGSAGKTSTKELLALLLGADAAAEDASPVLATRGNLNNTLGVPLTLTRLDAAVHEYAVVEAGISLPGEMAPLAAMIAPDVAIVTLVAPAHLAGLGDLESVAHEKALLAAAVRPSGIAIFPSACARFAAFRELRVPTLAVGASDAPVTFAVGRSESGTELALAGAAAPTGTFSLPRVTDGMAQNAVLALTAAYRLGVPADLMRRRLAAWHPVALRGEWIRQSDQLLYLDCYNANPASMTDALDAFVRGAPAALPRLFLIGGMEELGPEAARYHEEVGARLRLRPEDELWLIAGQAAAFRAGVLAAGGRADQITIAPSLEPLAARLAGFRGAVFIKGSRRYALETLVPDAVHGALHA